MIPPLTSLTNPNTESFVYKVGEPRKTLMPVRSNTSDLRPQEVIGYTAPAYPDEFYDLEIGVVPELFSRVDPESRRVYVSSNGVTDFSAGKLTIYKQFENTDSVYSQTINFSDFNSGAGEVLIHDFGFSDEKVKFKMVVTETFTRAIIL